MSWNAIGPLILIGVTTLSFLGGCTKGKPSTNYPAPGATQADEPPPTHKLSNSQIIGIMATVDSSQIQQARLALTRANDPRVRHFAADIIAQHTDCNMKVSAVASQYGLTSAPSDQASALQERFTSFMATLERAPLRAFDVTYVNAQIKEHEEILNTFHDLLPAADNEALTLQLHAASDLVQDSLDKAREILPLLQPDEEDLPAVSVPRT